MSRSFKASLVAALFAAGLTATLNAQDQSFRSFFSRNTKAGQSRGVTSKAAVTKVSPGGNQVVAQLPDLTIVRVEPDRDGTPPQKITVVNQGGLTAPSYSVRVMVYNGYEQLMYQIDIPNCKSLARGESQTLPLYTSAYGERWSVQLDPQNRIREANEKNNRWYNNRIR